jgi:hypothetical protein
MSQRLGAVGSIRLRTPAAWVDLDLDPVTRSGSIARVVEERGGADPEALTAMLEAAAGDAARQGGVFASLFSDAIGGKAVSASLVVSVADADPDIDSETDPARAGGIRVAIAEDLAAEFGGNGADAQVRSLEAGPAARVRCRLPVEEVGRTTEVDSLQYFVPFPNADRLAVLTFSTPNLGLADAFAEVFDAIAATLQWQS